MSKQIRFFDPKREVNFVRFFPSSLFLAAAIPVVTVLALGLFSLNWGIDFAGGTEMQVQFSKGVHADEIRDVLEKIGFGKNQVQNYGPDSANEKLIRIERATTFKDTDVEAMKTLLANSFAAEIAKNASSFQVTFRPDMGDRIQVKLPAPEVAADAAPDAMSNALHTQQAALATALDEKSGFKLRRTKGTEGAGDDLKDAISRNEPLNGVVTYTVHFTGVPEKVSKALADKFGGVELRRVDFVDSQVSKQLRTDGALAVFYAILAILIYLAVRFDMFFAPGAVVALLQDTLGALLVFIVFRLEFDLPSVAALLTVVGCSINNTIVVYDRIREHLPKGDKRPLTLEETVKMVNTAINETLGRSINTALTVLFTTVSLWIFAGGVVRNFAIALTVGVALGVFSSTFAAPAMYVFMRRHFAAREQSWAERRSSGPSREEKARGVV